MVVRSGRGCGINKTVGIGGTVATINELTDALNQILDKEWLMRQAKRWARRAEALVQSSTRQRQRVTAGNTYRMHTARGHVYVRIMWDMTGNPIEIFIDLENPDAHLRADTEGLARSLSLAFRHGATLEEACGQLIGIQDEPWREEGQVSSSLQDSVAQAIGLAIKDGPDEAIQAHMNREAGRLEGRKV